MKISLFLFGLVFVFLGTYFFISKIDVSEAGTGQFAFYTGQWTVKTIACISCKGEDCNPNMGSLTTCSICPSGSFEALPTGKGTGPVRLPIVCFQPGRIMPQGKNFCMGEVKVMSGYLLPFNQYDCK